MRIGGELVEGGRREGEGREGKGELRVNRIRGLTGVRSSKKISIYNLTCKNKRKIMVATTSATAATPPS